MSATTCEVRLQLNATEVLDSSEAPAAASEDDRRLSFNGFNASASLSSTSTPKIEKPPAAQSITLGGSPTTLNLTAMALARDAGQSHDYTGKKLVGFQLKANASNAGSITIAPGGSNPYPLFGTGQSRILGPGECESSSFIGAGSTKPAVSSTVKTIDISGTSGDKLDVLLLFGT